MKKKIIITTSWDDGHVLDLRIAHLLKMYGLSGTFYISPFNHEFKSSELLSDSEIKFLSNNFEIGAHTMKHPDLIKIPSSRAEKEIKDSKLYLEKIVGKKISSFCYPYGSYNLKVKNIVKEAGFKLARTVKRFDYGIFEPFEIGTSTHAYTHIRDLKNIKLLFLYRTILWKDLAKKQFDYVLKNGGVFHLWGHSWEIDKFNAWDDFEDVLKYIGGREKVLYMPNSKIILNGKN